MPLDGRSAHVFVKEYAIDPAWSPDGRFVAYSGPDIGTTFTVKAVAAEAEAARDASADPDSRSSTFGISVRRTGARSPAGRDST